MTKNRLEFLSDGVFAIVMTLLVVEITIPELNEFSSILPEMFSYFLSFAVLANLWTIHNFLFSIMSQNTTRALASLNILLLSFISLIPFSTSLLGQYPSYGVSVAFYSIHILIISLLSLGVREFIYYSPHVQNPDHESANITSLDRFYGTSRIVLNVAVSIIAVILSNFSTVYSIALLLVPVILGIIPGSLAWILKNSGIQSLIRPDLQQ